MVRLVAYALVPFGRAGGGAASGGARAGSAAGHRHGAASACIERRGDEGRPVAARACSGTLAAARRRFADTAPPPRCSSGELLRRHTLGERAQDYARLAVALGEAAARDALAAA